jgi:hypothetical protein
MKILLREHNGGEYVWRTAKYNGKNFVVDGNEVLEFNIVSIINDNRKNYVRCSSCGKIFPKNGNKFELHQATAKNIQTCFGCKNLRYQEISHATDKIICNKDGTYTRRFETTCNLVCRRSAFLSYNADSPEAIDACNLRQCHNGYGQDIHDIFTNYPGLFDDIITVDKIIANGYESRDINISNIEYNLSTELEIRAVVNNLGIVDRFVLYSETEWGYGVWYSKRYNMLFSGDCNGKYVEFSDHNIPSDQLIDIKKYLAKLYA